MISSWGNSFRVRWSLIGGRSAVYLAAENVRSLDRPVVAERHQNAQHVGERTRGSRAPRDEFGRLKIEYDEISFSAYVERADAVFEPEATRGTQGREIKRAQRM